jgi:hypothetical protein
MRKENAKRRNDAHLPIAQAVPDRENVASSHLGTAPDRPLGPVGPSGHVRKRLASNLVRLVAPPRTTYDSESLARHVSGGR